MYEMAILPEGDRAVGLDGEHAGCLFEKQQNGEWIRTLLLPIHECEVQTIHRTDMGRCTGRNGAPSRR
jgi:hypothetical protein